MTNIYQQLRQSNKEVGEALVLLLVAIQQHWEGDEQDLDMLANDIADKFDLHEAIAAERKARDFEPNVAT